LLAREDVLDRYGNERAQTGLTLLRLSGTDYQEVAAAADGFLEMQTLGLRIRADGMRLVLQEVAAGELLHTPQEFQAELQEAEQKMQAEKMARMALEQKMQAELHEIERKQHEAEQRAEEAERRLRELEEEIQRLRGSK
jgi:DNA repair exonuclease SbcCD ATPase subunit